MTKQAAIWIIVFCSILLLLAIIFAAKWDGNNSVFKDPASVLTFVGGAAVAIERLIEAMWTFIGGVAGTYWPLNLINKQVNAMVGELDTAMKPIYEQANATIDELAKAGKLVGEDLQKAKDEVAALEKRFNEFKNELPQDNERVKLLVATASQHADFLKKKYEAAAPKIDQAKGIADASINGLQNFVASFKDNPGRRLISIYLGVILGLLVAGYFRLDLFQAILAPADPKNPVVVTSIGYIILTGVVIGLGSSPTHEVIRAVQEYKKNMKGSNLSQPDLPDRQQK